ncbi:hypothetical protein [Pedococcus soli]
MNESETPKASDAPAPEPAPVPELQNDPAVVVTVLKGSGVPDPEGTVYLTETKGTDE